MSMNSSIVFYDAACPFCSKVVRFILKYEKDSKLFFSPLQSDYTKSFLPKYGVSEVDLSTFYLFHNNRVYSKSTAALRLLPFLKWYWFFFNIFWIFPPFIRDYMYGVIAKYRYRLFRDTCEIGNLSDERFLEKKV